MQQGEIIDSIHLTVNEKTKRIKIESQNIIGEQRGKTR
jgi:hypothetical protein